MTPMETFSFFALLVIIIALVVFIVYRELNKPKQETGSSEIETMFDYSPGIPPPKSISDTTSNVNQIGSRWSFLWG